MEADYSLVADGRGFDTPALSTVTMWQQQPRIGK